jgi:hypothetical protein
VKTEALHLVVPKGYKVRGRLNDLRPLADAQWLGFPKDRGGWSPTANSRAPTRRLHQPDRGDVPSDCAATLSLRIRIARPSQTS